MWLITFYTETYVISTYLAHLLFSLFRSKVGIDNLLDLKDSALMLLLGNVLSSNTVTLCSQQIGMIWLEHNSHIKLLLPVIDLKNIINTHTKQTTNWLNHFYGSLV